MPKLITKPHELEKILLRHGFILMRQTGSHRIYYSQSSKAKTTVPFHLKDMAKGTANSIVRQSRLPRKNFLK